MSDAAAIAAAGGSLVGAAGVTFAYLSGKADRAQARALAGGQHEHERLSAHHARLWERRSKVYEELLAFAERYLLAVERTHPVSGEPWGEPPGFLADSEYTQLRGRFAAFGSRRVIATLDQLECDVRRFFRQSASLEESEQQGEDVDYRALEPAREQVRSSLQILKQHVQDDLATPP